MSVNICCADRLVGILAQPRSKSAATTGPMTMIKHPLLGLLLSVVAVVTTTFADAPSDVGTVNPRANATQQSEAGRWATLLKPRYFQDREIRDDKNVVILRLPLRAEDA